MSVFLVLSSLSVAFYLFVVLALYRDNHKHRSKRIQGHSNVCFDKAKDQKVSHPAGYPKPRQVNFSDDVLWLLVTKVQLKRETSGTASAKRQPVALTVRHGSAGH
jgi:hypothetical protein